MDRSLWVFMKQFATGTAVLKTPRPITFELAFLAAVAAAVSHTHFSLGRRVCLMLFGVPLRRRLGSVGPEKPSSRGLLTYLGCLSGRLGLSCPVLNCPVIWSQNSFGRSLSGLLGPRTRYNSARAPGERVKSCLVLPSPHAAG